MRVMIDTNVIISYAMFRSARIRQVFEIAWEDGNALLVPDYVLAEAREVVMRKWPARAGELEVFLASIRFEKVVTPAEVGVELRIRDARDLPVLRAAVAGGADAIVTGDADFSDACTGGVPVYAPADFADLVQRGRLS